MQQKSKLKGGCAAADWELRVRELEAEGLTRSDAQAVVDAEDAKNPDKGGMTRGGRIATYAFFCALWALFLYGLPELVYNEAQRKIYDQELAYNRQLVKHRATMAELNAEYQGLLAEERLTKACYDEHPNGPEAVDLCRASAKLDVAAATLKALRKRR